MDLRSGRSFWTDKRARLDIATETGNSRMRCDVAVIGAGITGALIAYLLSRHGVDVVILDKRQVSRGSTAASTALLMYEVDRSLSELSDRFGSPQAERFYHASLGALTRLLSLIRDANIDCGLARRDSVYMASTKRHARALNIEYTRRVRAGIEVELLSPNELAQLVPDSKSIALLSSQGGQVDPVRLTEGLLRRLIQSGTRVYDDTKVLAIDPSPRAVSVTMSGGRSVRARMLVIAAGYECHEFMSNPPGALHSTFVACSTPMTNGGGPCPIPTNQIMLWETARPYIYLRGTEDHRVIIGGFDMPFQNETARDRILPKQTARLERRWRTMFPDAPFETEFAWAGTFGDSDHGLPYIGSVPDFPGCMFAMCFGGNGLTWGMLAAEIIRDRFLERSNPDCELFGFDRS